MRAFADILVAPEEIHEIGAFEQHLRHPRVVIILLRDMAVGAGFGLASAYRVGVVRIERLAAVALRRDGLLLVIDPLAVGILRTDYDGARGAHWHNLMVLGSAV